MDFLNAAIQQKQQSLNKKRTWTQSKETAPAAASAAASAAPSVAASPAPSPAPAPSAAAEEGPARKYVRRGELRKLEEQERERQRQTTRELRRVKQQDAAAADAEARTARQVANGQGAAAGDAQAGAKVSPAEIRRRLRLIGQPITLFGETDVDRLRRLKNVELDHVERVTGATSGHRNVLQDILAQDVERDIERELEEAYGGLDEAGMVGEGGEGRGGSAAKAQADRERQERNAARYAQDRSMQSFGKDPEQAVIPYLLFWLKRMLWLWEEDLAARPEDEKRSPQGRLAAAQQKQTRQYIRPLARKLKSGGVAPDVLAAVRKMVDFCRKGEYVRANSEYLVLSIGNAAWPMGVTMVGIHERSGREKIFSHNVAHILDDAESQKWIHALKRLMTFSQNKFPSAPSKMVRL